MIRNRLASVNTRGLNWKRIGEASDGLSHSELTIACEQAAKQTFCPKHLASQQRCFSLHLAIDATRASSDDHRWLLAIVLTSSSVDRPSRSRTHRMRRDAAALVTTLTHSS